MKHTSNIKPGDLVRIYDYTHKRRESMRAIAADADGPVGRQYRMRAASHKVGLVVSEYPDDTVWPSDYKKYSPDEADGREWNIILVGWEGGIDRGSNNQIIVHDNRLERMVKEQCQE